MTPINPPRSIQRIDRIQLAPGPHRVAVMAGAWGNTSALEACLLDATARRCDTFAFLGDSIGVFGHSDDILATIRKRFPILVAGDTEKRVLAKAGFLGNPTSSPEARTFASLAYSQAVRGLDETDRHWFAAWPDAVLLDTAAGRLLFCHGNPQRTDEPLFESVFDPARISGWLDEYAAQSLMCAHTGIPWVHPLVSNRTAANCGAVGIPDHDTDPAVHYLVVSVADACPMKFEIPRIEYDYETFIAARLAEGLDPAVLLPLRTGVWVHGVEELPPRERRRPDDNRPGSPNAM